MNENTLRNVELLMMKIPLACRLNRWWFICSIALSNWNWAQLLCNWRGKQRPTVPAGEMTYQMTANPQNPWSNMFSLSVNSLVKWFFSFKIPKNITRFRSIRNNLLPFWSTHLCSQIEKQLVDIFPVTIWVELKWKSFNKAD